MSNIDKQGRQVQRYANFGVDMMEWADGGYVKHSDYLALLDELEAKEKRTERALSLLNRANTDNVWDVIGRLKVVIGGDYRSESEIAAAAGKGEAS